MNFKTELKKRLKTYKPSDGVDPLKSEMLKALTEKNLSLGLEILRLQHEENRQSFERLETLLDSSFERFWGVKP